MMENKEQCRTEDNPGKRERNQELKLSYLHLKNTAPRQGKVVRVYTSHAVGRRLVPRQDHTKAHHKNGTNFLLAWHAGIRVEVF